MFSTSFQPRTQCRDGQQTDYYLVNHCSSEGPTVGIKSYLSSRLNLQFKTRISKAKQNFQFNFKRFQNTFQFNLNFKIQNKMSETIELSYVWDHTIQKILNYDLQSKMGNMIKDWLYSTNWKISIHC